MEKVINIIRRYSIPIFIILLVIIIGLCTIIFLKFSEKIEPDYISTNTNIIIENSTNENIEDTNINDSEKIKEEEKENKQEVVVNNNSIPQTELAEKTNTSTKEETSKYSNNKENNNINSNTNINNNSNNINSDVDETYIYLGDIKKILDDKKYFTKYKLNIIDNAKNLEATDGTIWKRATFISGYGPEYRINGEIMTTNVAWTSYGTSAFVDKNELLKMKIVCDEGYTYIRQGINLSDLTIEFGYEYSSGENTGTVGFIFKPKLEVSGNTITLTLDAKSVTGHYYG